MDWKAPRCWLQFVRLLSVAARADVVAAVCRRRPCACRGAPPSAPPAAPASYNSFQYWRNPLPDVDLSPAAAAAASGSTPASEGDEPEPPGGWDEAGASEGGGDAACLEAITAELRVGGGGGGGEIHTAAVETSATPAVETVANFGSTHVLGQHVSETTLSVVGGVVHGQSTPLGGPCVIRG